LKINCDRMNCLIILNVMKIKIIPCGTLKVHAGEMHSNLPVDRISSYYEMDPEGYMRITMNALLVDSGAQVVLFDPGCADFLPSRFVASYDLEILVPLEQILKSTGYEAEQVTDVIFTHLHFDHGSGAFLRKPGRICKRFPNARYHVLKEHYEYARKPDKGESNSFTTFFFKYLDAIHWLEDWKEDWMEFGVFHGHTRAMVVPGINTGEGKTWYLTDLIPMRSFLEPDVSSGYDLDPGLALREKVDFLRGLPKKSELIFFHDPLTDRQFYP
jgi:glyoxylase-like metal-dependent hydrolase (beta-lactamase superfamily II)